LTAARDGAEHRTLEAAHVVSSIPGEPEAEVDLHLAILDRLDAPRAAVSVTTRRRPRPLRAMFTVVVLVLVATAGHTERATVAKGPITIAAPEPAPVPEPPRSEEDRLANVERLSGDTSDRATDALVATADDPSLIVAMAGVRALRGRPCARVADTLGRTLGHADWQRRAWAAKVLGDNGCRTATATLRARLAREPDPRVRRQLSTALTTLRTAG
jgi:hypothetical protein